MINKEALQKAWDLVHDKYPDNNEEIQLVRYAIKAAMSLADRDTPKKVFIGGIDKQGKFKDVVCPICHQWLTFTEKENFCPKCGQRIDWSE